MTLCSGAVHSSNIELVVNKISQLIKKDEMERSDDSNNSLHERKGSYKVAVNTSSTSMKSPIERKIKSKAIISAKENDERGYKSDVELFSKEKTSFDAITGYSSDCELTSKRMNRLKEVVPKESDSESALNQMPYDSNSSKRSQNDIQMFEIKDIPKDNKEKAQNIEDSNQTQNSPKSNKTPKSSEVVTDKVVSKNPMNSEINNSLNGRQRPMSLCSDQWWNKIETTNGSQNPNTISSQRSLPRNGSVVVDPKSQIPALPLKPSNFGHKSEPVVSNRLKQPQTASSQFIFHKFSHDFYTQPKPLIGQNSTSHTIFSPEDIHLDSDTNGINLIDESNGSDPSNHSTNHSSNHSSNKLDSSLLSRPLNSSAHVVSIERLDK